MTVAAPDWLLAMLFATWILNIMILIKIYVARRHTVLIIKRIEEFHKNETNKVS